MPVNVLQYRHLGACAENLLPTVLLSNVSYLHLV